MKEPRKKSYKLFDTYPIAAMSGQLGPKQKQGDRQAPEGFYVIGKRQLNAHASDHLAIDLGFPNVYDRTHERTGSAFVAQSSRSPNGSYAMSAPAIEEIYPLLAAALENGQQFVSVHAFPFRMTSRRIREASRDLGRWLPFWQNLKSGYDWFERRSAPPNVIIKDRQYRFLEF